MRIIRNADLLKAANTGDLAKFYRDRFYTGGVLDARYFDAVNRFNIGFARTMWVYDNVRRGASVLDIGCGEGVLALLRRKGEHMKGLRRSWVTRTLWSAVLTGGILLTCPAPAAAQQTPAPAQALYRWITPPPDQQLKADTTPVPSGMGAV